jgi:hypothetical protein
MCGENKKKRRGRGRRKKKSGTFTLFHTKKIIKLFSFY